jgi:hypothetical protein
MSAEWRPITREEFDTIVSQQAAELTPSQREMLERYGVVPRQAIIRRSTEAGDEPVWIIAERDGQVLYYDDVEEGWNPSEVDKVGRILRPGGGQGRLRDVLGDNPDGSL